MSAGEFSYDYPRPAVTVDIVVFGIQDGPLEVLLIERGEPPFRGCWALPGGFVRMGEGLEAAARRELAEETGVTELFIEQLFTFGAVERDPRGRVVSVAYYGLVRPSHHRLHATTDASDARWYPVDQLPELAFDHAAIIETALARLRGKLTYRPVGFELLPEKFKLSQLRELYETILERPLDKRNFRRKLLKMGVLQPLEEREENVAHRAARFFRFDREAYAELEARGVDFDL